MKNLLLLLMAIGILLTLGSCDKTKEDENKVNEQTGEPELFSDLDPEKHKTNIEDAGVKVVSEMSDLVTSNAAKAAVHFSSLMGGEEDTSYEKTIAASPASILIEIEKLSNNEISVAEFANCYYKLKGAFEDDEPETAEEWYNENKGTLTWNAAADSFEHVKGDKLIVEFPASNNATTNNAIFTVDAFDTDIIADNEVPVSVIANLTVDGTKEIELSLSGTYKTDGSPEKLDASLTISGYILSTSLVNNNEEVSIENSFKHGEVNILSTKVGVNGNFSEANIENNSSYFIQDCWEDNWGEEYCEDPIEVTADDEYDYIIVDIEEVLEGSFGYIDLLNIRVGGEVDVAKMIPVMDKIDDDEDAAEEEFWNNWQQGDPYYFNSKPYVEREVDAMNQYMDFYSAYVSEQTKIADLEFFVLEETDEWGTEYDVSGRFVFGDSSKINMDVYFEDIIKGVFVEMNKIIATINSTYGDYMDEAIKDLDYDEIFSEEDEEEHN